MSPRRNRPGCFRCGDTGYVETRQTFAATKYSPACTVIDSVACPHCKNKTKS